MSSIAALTALILSGTDMPAGSTGARAGCGCSVGVGLSLVASLICTSRSFSSFVTLASSSLIWSLVSVSSPTLYRSVGTPSAGASAAASSRSSLTIRSWSTASISSSGLLPAASNSASKAIESLSRSSIRCRAAASSAMSCASRAAAASLASVKASSNSRISSSVYLPVDALNSSRAFSYSIAVLVTGSAS